MSERIAVNLGDRSYNIHVGARLLAQAGALLKAHASGVVPVVTDTNVAALHLAPLLASLRGANIEAREILVPAGESTKSFKGLEALSSALLSTGVDRGGLIVALGGGVVGDLAGFAAGILKRGIDFAQIPTTLLAQVDSSVGGKTAIDTPEGKNLVGLFHQPKIVIADIDVIGTLPQRELKAGYAEVVKYGALGDAAFFEWLERSGPAVLAGDPSAKVQAVAHSCRMKADIVTRDEREAGDRALLNLGHTFGHALEATMGYDGRLLHGEAIAIGMVLAFALSAKLGHCSRQEVERFRQHLQAVGLPSRIADITGPAPDTGALLAHMAHDKKVKDGRIAFVLVRGIGQAFVTRDVPEEAVRDVLAAG